MDSESRGFGQVLEAAIVLEFPSGKSCECRLRWFPHLMDEEEVFRRSKSFGSNFDYIRHAKKWVSEPGVILYPVNDGDVDTMLEAEMGVYLE